MKANYRFLSISCIVLVFLICGCVTRDIKFNSSKIHYIVIGKGRLGTNLTKKIITDDYNVIQYSAQSKINNQSIKKIHSNFKTIDTTKTQAMTGEEYRQKMIVLKNTLGDKIQYMSEMIILGARFTKDNQNVSHIAQEVFSEIKVIQTDNLEETNFKIIDFLNANKGKMESTFQIKNTNTCVANVADAPFESLKNITPLVDKNLLSKAEIEKNMRSLDKNLKRILIHRNKIKIDIIVRGENNFSYLISHNTANIKEFISELEKLKNKSLKNKVNLRDINCILNFLKTHNDIDLKAPGIGAVVRSKNATKCIFHSYIPYGIDFTPDPKFIGLY